jgi:formate-dependent nitrite reductase membrane component NrfD
MTEAWRSASPDAVKRGREEQPTTPAPSPRTGQAMRPGWDGPTYYGRPQLKPAPFHKGLVGGYIFLAGLSGSSSLLSAIADLAGGRAARRVVRRGRRLALLAPTLGSPLLIKDLHTPKRFYNMLRVFKPRSPMSVGSWILMGSAASSVPAAAADFLSDRWPGFGWLAPVARAAQAPAAAAGAGLSVYTAALLSATSTPAWAAVPASLAVRFGASSVASAASALLLGERASGARRALELTALSALTVEAGAAVAQEIVHHRKGVEQASRGKWGAVERGLASGLGVAVPIALFGAALLSGRRRSLLSDAAALATLVGGLALRISTLGVGDESAARHEISLRFAQPENLPHEPSRSRLDRGAAGLLH